MLLGSMFTVLGLMLAVLDRCWGRFRRSWRHLEPLLMILSRLGLKKSKNMTTLKMCLFLERERDLRPGGGLEPLLGPMLAVLVRSWGLCSRFWACAGDLGLLLGPILAILGRSWGLC